MPFRKAGTGLFRAVPLLTIPSQQQGGSSSRPAVFIENALSPAKVVSVYANEEEKTASVIVPDYQLSLAIGKEGQNARLAARLTGYKIDIKSESQAYDEAESLEDDYMEDDIFLEEIPEEDEE